MTVMHTVSALTIRRNLGEILNRIIYNKEEIFVERSGKIVAKIIPAEKIHISKKNIKLYAGIWKTPIVKTIKSAIKSTRKKPVLEKSSLSF